MKLLCVLVIVGCGSSQPAPAQPAVPVAPGGPADAAVDAAPDALPQAVLGAPAWVFGYHTAERSETWTLRHADGTALLVVATVQGERRYVGSAVEDPSGDVKLDVSTGTAKLALDCKHDKLAVSATCNDRKAKPIDVLSCYHVDFKTPMPFGPAPGIEYVVDASCNGYRLKTP